jgi:hypothetical protein
MEFKSGYKLGNVMEKVTLKAEALRLIDRLPENCSWEDLMSAIYVQQVVESGLKDSEQGRVTAVEDVRKQFGLS